MITITETDTNLPEVLTESKLHNLVTASRYHVYGLRREENPVVLIEYETAYVPSGFRERMDSLEAFLKLNGIIADVIKDSGDHCIEIGLRIDLRKVLNKNGKPLLAASVLKTIVYCLEDRLDIENMKRYKLASIPTFPE